MAVKYVRLSVRSKDVTARVGTALPRWLVDDCDEDASNERTRAEYSTTSAWPGRWLLGLVRRQFSPHTNGALPNAKALRALRSGRCRFLSGRSSGIR